MAFRRLYGPLSFGLVIFVLDGLSKFATHMWIPLMDVSAMSYPYGGIGIFENVFGIECSISHRTNTGAAWGIFADYQPYLVAFRIALIIGIVIYLFAHNKKPLLRWPLVLIIVGAVGNVLDFFLYGHVVDMIHFKFWGYDYPVFNVADSTIFIGVAWLLFLSLFEKKGHLENK